MEQVVPWRELCAQAGERTSDGRQKRRCTTRSPCASSSASTSGARAGSGRDDNPEFPSSAPILAATAAPNRASAGSRGLFRLRPNTLSTGLY